MIEVVVFKPKAELDAAENLRGFVESCRNELTVFGADLPFDADVWDVTASLDIKGHGKKRQRLVFGAGAADKKGARGPMSEPFLSFAKAYIRYMHGLRPSKAVVFRLSALRCLEAALKENGEAPDPVRIDASVLNRTAQLIGDRYTEAAAYRVGQQLEGVAAFLSANRLTAVPCQWRNSLPRPQDAVRVGKAFDERREAKMPSQEVLEVLPKAFRVAREPLDVIVTSVAAILCSSPDRISEVLLLPDACEVRQKGRNGEDIYGLRWWPEKGAEPMVKWVVPSMSGVVQEAIAKIRAATAQARKVAKWYEDHPGRIYLEGDTECLRHREWISVQEVAEVVGLSDVAAARVWCKAHDVTDTGARGAKKVRFMDLEKAVLAMLPDGFPILSRDTGLKYSDALLVARTNELHPGRGTYRCMVAPITINQINSGLGARVEFGFASAFERLGFRDVNGEPLRVSTHQFRHYLNTLAQAGGMSQLDIAKWSGRKDIRQNAAYDHVTADQMLAMIRGAVGDDSQMFGPLAELPKRALMSRDEFARLKVPTAHTTDLGFCIHDYTMSPCQLHAECIRCEELVCVKGDDVRTRRLRDRLAEARHFQEQAEDAIKEGYAGSDRWSEHHEETVMRLGQLLSLMDDPEVPMGSVIQLSPSLGREGLAVRGGDLPEPVGDRTLALPANDTELG